MQDKFKMAVYYAKSVCYGADDGLKEAYTRASRPRQNLYSRALEDFMASPVVQSIDSSRYSPKDGGIISIRAVDDFRVVSVHLEIYTLEGVLLEKGNAIQETNGIVWTYTATQTNNSTAATLIKAIARDVSGNEEMLQIII